MASRGQTDAVTPLVRAAEQFARKALEGRDGSHDFAHARRVQRLTRAIASSELLAQQEARMEAEAAARRKLSVCDIFGFSATSPSPKKRQRVAAQCTATMPRTIDVVFSENRNRVKSFFQL